jgi:hypothetical protein
MKYEYEQTRKYTHSLTILALSLPFVSLSRKLQDLRQKCTDHKIRFIFLYLCTFCLENHPSDKCN